MSTTTQHWSCQLVELKACREAMRWVQQQPSAEQAWQSCERGDWMLWIAGRCSGEVGSPKRKLLGLVACGCARLALPCTKDKQVLKCIEVTEAYCKGDLDVTLADVRKARQDAYADADAYAAAYAAAEAAADAADTADYADAAYAAAAAAYAAADAAYAAAYAATYAAYATYAAAYATYAADSAAYAADAAKMETLRKCADIVRTFYPNHPIIK